MHVEAVKHRDAQLSSPYQADNAAQHPAHLHTHHVWTAVRCIHTVSLHIDQCNFNVHFNVLRRQHKRFA